MDVARKHELDLGEPLFHRFRFRLGPLIISLEVVGKVAVQVETPGVVPEKLANLHCTQSINIKCTIKQYCNSLTFLDLLRRCLLPPPQIRLGSSMA